jgi:hypothetical protein
MSRCSCQPIGGGLSNGAKNPEELNNINLKICQVILRGCISSPYLPGIFPVPFPYRSHTPRILFSYTLHTLFIHSSYSFHTLFILSSYSFYTLFILFSYTLHTLLIHIHTLSIHYQRRMNTLSQTYKVCARGTEQGKTL